MASACAKPDTSTSEQLQRHSALSPSTARTRTNRAPSAPVWSKDPLQTFLQLPLCEHGSTAKDYGAKNHNPLASVLRMHM